MLKKIFFTGLLVISAQNVMAFGLSDVNDAANQASDAANTTQKAADKVEQVNDKSISGMAKTVATDSAKEGVNGAVQGAMSGKIVEGGASGAVDGAKTSINKLMN
ncbi:hypothetical protein [methanotrophic endosymbiont of Bathymodiolus puteoserpentis (Logatchev)]|jgi:hypothetical protein|uniref:hypothetical protein n=1 Tax=methanotrophic endosymbiont of Bathymodiolus puteoserpentis (Logatchev) TaxID=343235 RepID=UPI0013C5D257|nr:hypothetical protein [methanotrophic endosymbiont of Bathymodiolus puteoserpentis (Logatchev)]SHE22601.1 hypothetical protein BPUTEOMOX_2313 [methanotrophic endosymbiont of Bathymodiolus puteoserpentis (Logatchev)]